MDAAKVYESADIEERKMYNLVKDMYVGHRRSGKTYTIIHRAKETGLPILVIDVLRKRHMLHEAKRLGIDGIEVITLEELKRHHTKNVLVDEAQTLLENILNVSIPEMTVSAPRITLLPQRPWE